MKIVIDIPDEFIPHFNSDRFKDSLERLESDSHLLAGNYEKELCQMLIKAFDESLILREATIDQLCEDENPRDNRQDSCYSWLYYQER